MLGGTRTDLWIKRWLMMFAAGALMMIQCGCQTAQYYRQAIRGQYQILTQRRPIAELLSNPDTSYPLKQKLRLVGRLRNFAESELKLPVDRNYLTYVDLGRRFAVWNVHAAPAFSLEPKKWWYPLVGSLKYRGYFSEEDARQYAAQLAVEGADVHVEGVEAYSTLGWFADPLLNTFIHHEEAYLAEIIFHELAHQRLFLAGDTDFNEAFATVVAEEGVRRWLAANQDEASYQEYQRELKRNRQFVALILNTRQELRSLYGERDPHRAFRTASHNSAPGWRREEKARILAGLRESYEELKAEWGGYSGYDAWMAQPLNNAQLNTIALYYELVPGFQALLERGGADLEVFYRCVQNLRKLSNEDRRRHLVQMGSERIRPG